MRKTWHEYFMELTHLVSTRSTCLRRKVGCVAVKDNKILSTGYNGSPSGLDHCLDIGCLRDKLNISSGTQHEKCRAIHSEQNAIIQATCLKGATIYCTHTPCSICTKMLINAGIKAFYYDEFYPDETSIEMLKQANIIFKHYKEA